MTSVPLTQPPAAPETDVRLNEAIERGLRRCRVEDAPVPLIKEHDLFHVAHMVAAELAPLLEAARERVRVVEGERDEYKRGWVEADVSADYATARAESAEAALAELRAGVATLASRLLHFDALNEQIPVQVDVPDDYEAGVNEAGRHLRALLGGAS